jgi:hypothetical protein
MQITKYVVTKARTKTFYTVLVRHAIFHSIFYCGTRCLCLLFFCLQICKPKLGHMYLKGNDYGLWMQINFYRMKI